METEFTKGEWERRDNHIFIKGTYNRVALVSVQDNYEPVTFIPKYDVEAEANARLIVNSPKLFKTVVELQKKLDMLISLTPTGDRRNDLCDLNIQTLCLLEDIITKTK